MGKGLIAAACVLGAAAYVAPASGAGEDGPLSTNLQQVKPRGGASAAANTTIFVLAGTPNANTISASGDSTGRLVITSPDGIVEPDGPAPECSQDSPTQVSCMPGFIGALAGDLGAGNDTFTAQTSLPTLIGISLVSQERPMSGGLGNDRIAAGLGGDLILGGPGNDALLGFGGGDLINGETGRDTVSGGGAPDDLLGGAGPDRLHGGSARDLCNGGGGVDTAKSCNVTRRVP
jgi:Ca2+-binding RTX toxin-like protein